MKLFYILNFGILLIFTALFFVMHRINSRRSKINNYLNMVANAVTSIRYGNLATKIDEGHHPTFKSLTESINRMVETLNDREQMIIEYQNELLRQSALKEDFVVTLTHDLKVPIIAESNVLNFLLDEKFGEISEKQREVLMSLKKSNRELLDFIQVLLETYKINEAGLEPVKKEFDLNNLLTDIICDMQLIAVDYDINIHFEPECAVVVNADSLQLTRVIKNILSNAVMHSSTEKIDIEVSKTPEFTTISIIDYGRGICAEDVKMIFSKYYCAGSKFRRIGTGLGLYLAQQIIKSHGGEIIVNSEEDVRTEFCIRLPV